MLRQRTNYALNDFDDNYSISDVNDLSMLSGSVRHMRSVTGVPFIEAGGLVMLPNTSQVMRQMAADSNQMIPESTAEPFSGSRRNSFEVGNSRVNFKPELEQEYLADKL